jgi:hypothetical protein
MPVREPHSLGQLSTGLNLRILTMAIHEDYGTASLALAMTVAKYFDLDAAKGRGDRVRDMAVLFPQSCWG